MIKEVIVDLLFILLTFLKEDRLQVIVKLLENIHCFHQQIILMFRDLKSGDLNLIIEY